MTIFYKQWCSGVHASMIASNSTACILSILQSQATATTSSSSVLIKNPFQQLRYLHFNFFQQIKGEQYITLYHIWHPSPPLSPSFSLILGFSWALGHPHSTVSGLKILPLISTLLPLVSSPWLMVLQPSCNLLQLPAFLFEINVHIYARSSTWVCSSSSSSSKKASLLVLELRWHGVLNLWFRQISIA